MEHPEYGEIVQLQGDQRNLIKDFLKKVGIAKEGNIKVITYMTQLIYLLQGEKNVQLDRGLNTGPLAYRAVALPTELSGCLAHYFPPFCFCLVKN